MPKVLLAMGLWWTCGWTDFSGDGTCEPFLLMKNSCCTHAVCLPEVAFFSSTFSSRLNVCSVGPNAGTGHWCFQTSVPTRSHHWQPGESQLGQLKSEARALQTTLAAVLLVREAFRSEKNRTSFYILYNHIYIYMLLIYTRCIYIYIFDMYAYM